MVVQEGSERFTYRLRSADERWTLSSTWASSTAMFACSDCLPKQPLGELYLGLTDRRPAAGSRDELEQIAAKCLSLNFKIKFLLRPKEDAIAISVGSFSGLGASFTPELAPPASLQINWDAVAIDVSDHCANLLMIWMAPRVAGKSPLLEVKSILEALRIERETFRPTQLPPVLAYEELVRELTKPRP